MADNDRKVDLREVEPLRPPPDGDAPGSPHGDDATDMPTDLRPADGLADEVARDQRTSEDEALENLRRG